MAYGKVHILFFFPIFFSWHYGKVHPNMLISTLDMLIFIIRSIKDVGMSEINNTPSISSALIINCQTVPPPNSRLTQQPQHNWIVKTHNKEYIIKQNKQKDKNNNNTKNKLYRHLLRFCEIAQLLFAFLTPTLNLLIIWKTLHWYLYMLYWDLLYITPTPQLFENQ